MSTWIYAAIAAFTSACVPPSAKIPANTDQSIPAAQAHVEVQPGKNGNHHVTLAVKHLAPPGEISEGARYVVWIDAAGTETPPANIGTLLVDADRKGKFETTTAFRTFDVFVTAENASTTTTPRGKQLISARVVDLKQ